MRVTNQQLSMTMLSTLRASNSKTADLMTKINAGQRVQRASDDPIAAVRLLMLERDTSVLKRYQKNIDTLSVRLQKNEAHLDGMLGTVMSAHDTLLSAADGSHSAADLNAMAGPLRTLLDNLKQAANAKDGHQSRPRSIHVRAGVIHSCHPFSWRLPCPCPEEVPSPAANPPPATDSLDTNACRNVSRPPTQSGKNRGALLPPAAESRRPRWLVATPGSPESRRTGDA